MMVSTSVIGAVEYRISTDEADCVEARYLSTGSMAQDAGIVCRGKAKGDTSNGFPGTYVIQYFGTNGDLVGEFDWAIEPVGEGFRLTWANKATNPTLPMEPGMRVFEGFGFPNSDRSIVVAYWMTEEASARMASAIAGA
jgi:hypothetical protein